MVEKVTIGNATLYCGDCREVLLELHNTDALITDPFYGVNLGVKKNSKKNRDKYIGFEDTPENVEKIAVPAVIAALSKSRRGLITPGVKCMWMYPKPRHVGAIYYPAASGCNSWGFSCWQPMLYYGSDPYGGKGSRPDSFESTESTENNGHPCPKPINQTSWMVNRATLHNEEVLDIFMGSGTTGVACMRFGRKFIGIEIERRYFDIACGRIEQAQAQGQLIPFDQPKPEQWSFL